MFTQFVCSKRTEKVAVLMVRVVTTKYSSTDGGLEIMLGGIMVKIETQLNTQTNA
jgi:hypothetical protein